METHDEDMKKILNPKVSDMNVRQNSENVVGKSSVYQVHDNIKARYEFALQHKDLHHLEMAYAQIRFKFLKP